MMRYSSHQLPSAAFRGASVFVLLLNLILLLSRSVAAAEVGESPVLMFDEEELDKTISKRSPLEAIYEPIFGIFGRSITGRAPPGVTGLLNNVRENRNVRPGTLQSFAFESSRIFERTEPNAHGTVGSNATTSGNDASEGDEEEEEEEENGADSELRRRQNRSKMIYISATTCLQPQRRGNNTSVDPPQLTLYVSTSSNNEQPGPDESSSAQDSKVFEEGAVIYNVNATGDVFFGIAAPASNQSMFEGEWNFDIAVSTEDYYHNYDTGPSGVLWVDSDSSAALLQTPNLTDTTDPSTVQRVMDDGPQYVMFVDNEDSTASRGVRHSMCGLTNYARLAARVGGTFGDNATTVMTTRGPGGFPKQQFHFNGLNSSTWYWGILAYAGSESQRRQAPNRAGGGGEVFQAVPFETKEGDNCKIITDLEFCNETEYAVPANDERFDIAELARFYDDHARDMYRNFERHLAQEACEAPSHQRYSLARDCSDCEQSYKKWLCSVTIPRCEDFSGENPHSLVRNLDQAFPNGSMLPEEIRQSDEFQASKHRRSRNARIDDEVAPGPYREILPCEDLCYDLVRDCPASLAFSCPRPFQDQFNSSYARRGDGLTCNYPGSVHNPNLSPRLALPRLLLPTVVAVVLGLVSF